MVCPFAIAKAFGLDTATRLRNLHRANLKNVGRRQMVRPAVLCLRFYSIKYGCSGSGRIQMLRNARGLPWSCRPIGPSPCGL